VAYYALSKLVAGMGEAVADSSTPFTLTALGTTNATVVKAGPGVVTSLHVTNFNAAARYLRFYDTAKAPTAGVGTPVRKYGIPANSTTGAGFALAPMLPMAFKVGIAFTLTTGVADTDATALTANDVVITIEYV
jgi:hypothetical protein